jgi:hypothetical protein
MTSHIYFRDHNGELRRDFEWCGHSFVLFVVPGQKPRLYSEYFQSGSSIMSVLCEVLDMDEKLERELLIGEIRGYLEILNAKGIDSPLRSIEVLDTMSILDLRILTRRLRDMARTPTA